MIERVDGGLDGDLEGIGVAQGVAEVGFSRFDGGGKWHALGETGGDGGGEGAAGAVRAGHWDARGTEAKNLAAINE